MMSSLSPVSTFVIATAAVLLQAACDMPEPDEPAAGDAVQLRDIPQPPLVDGNVDPADWPSYGRDLWNTRHNPAEPDHTKVKVPKIRWKVDLGGDVTATPAVVGNVVYVGAANGQFAALDTATGAALWSRNLDGEQITASASVSDGRVYIPTHAGFLYALDPATGATLWATDLTDGKPHIALFGSAVQADGVIYIGVASKQGFPSGDPIDFQGSLVALDPGTGDILWQRYFATGDEYGAPVWSTAAVNAGKVYIGTGQAYADPVSPYTDSMVALNAASGAIDWHKQWWADDIFIILNPQGPDYDFGASPNLFWLGDRMVVGEGSKSGDYHVMDAEDGTEVWSKRLTNGGMFGGFLGSTAYVDGRIHAVVNNLLWINDPRLPLLPTGGKYMVFSAATGKVLYSAPMAPTFSPVTVAGGVVYYTDLLGTVWARNAATGAVLWSLPTLELSGSGPSVSRGTLYVGTGVVSTLAVPLDDAPSPAHHVFAIDIDGI